MGVGVQSDLLHMASGSAKNGQQSITEEMMLYVKHKSLRADDIPDVIAAAAKTPATLLGWQVSVFSPCFVYWMVCQWTRSGEVNTKKDTVCLNSYYFIINIMFIY